MQTKSYRFLKWTLLACVSASLASACVVTTGDGGGDDFFDDGGEGGSSTNTAGTKTSGGAGTSATAGKGGAGSGGGGATTTAGSGGSAAGSGGTEPAYDPGVCDASSTAQEGPTPSELADPTITASDMDGEHDCRKCMKEKCATEWSICFGESPHIACGWGANNAGEDGQFECIQHCFEDGAKDPMGTAEDLLTDCSAMCTNQCEDEDGGNVMFHTSELISCVNKPTTCQDDCFPF
jgi:hypothetical protein